MRTVATLVVFLIFGSAAQAQVRMVPAGGAFVLDGDPPRLVVTGLKPGETATIHAFRKTQSYDPPGYTPMPLLAHAQAAFTADVTGMIAVDSATPLRGTYAGVDPLGLLWSGTRMKPGGSPRDPVTRGVTLAGPADILFRVEAPSLGVGKWAETIIRLTDGADRVDVQTVSVPGLHGILARPKSQSSAPLPAIILLHGSEGGSSAAAQASAIRFAQLGYAALAVNYFAWPGAGLVDVPQALVGIPVEVLASARAWFLQIPGVDASSVAVWGVSKGAELALVGAAHYPWIDRVVACVPSSVVWSGFGRAPTDQEIYSSWSIAGQGLPYIPYDHFEDVLNRTLSSAFVHQRSLDKAGLPQRAAARIPIDKSDAQFLLLAAAKDVVWPSAMMAREIEASMRSAHKESAVHAIVFPNASNYICGTGSEPRRINPVHKPEGDDPTPEADAAAAAAGWIATKSFLSRRAPSTAWQRPSQQLP